LEKGGAGEKQTNDTDVRLLLAYRAALKDGY